MAKGEAAVSILWAAAVFQALSKGLAQILRPQKPHMRNIIIPFIWQGSHSSERVGDFPEITQLVGSKE